MEKITTAQLRKLYALANELGLDNETLHAAVLRETGKEHISELTKAEAVRVIDVLINPSANLTAAGNNRASSRQVSYIKGLAKDMGWDEKRMLGFVKKVGHVDSLNWLHKYSAGKVIEGMKKLKEKGIEAYGDKER